MNKSLFNVAAAGLVCAIGMFGQLAAHAAGAYVRAQVQPDRTVLPIPQPAHERITEPDVRKAKPPPRFRVTEPKGSPNVLLDLIDEMGFGQPSAFGGPIAIPTMERIAREGLRFNRFQTTAICSATRAVLLTGCNAHAVNSGDITEIATARQHLRQTRYHHSLGADPAAKRLQ